MPEQHLKQSGFTYSGCGPFTRHRERIKKFRETGNLKHLCRNELYKTCFDHDAGNSDSKDLDSLENRIQIQIIISDKILKNRVDKIASRHQGLGSMVYKFFDKKTGLEVSVNEKWLKNYIKHPTNNFKFKNFLLEPTSVVKSSDKEKYVYSGYEVTFEGGGL